MNHGGVFNCIINRLLKKFKRKEQPPMPYKKLSELPDQVKVLPIAARMIWMRAFNAALKQYKNEETALKIAWGAVKRMYEKKGSKWVKKEPK